MRHWERASRGPMIAEDAHDFSGDLGRLVTLHEDIEGRSDGEASRAHLAADEDIEATNAALHCGYEREVLRLRVGAVRGAAGDDDVELARQVDELGIAFGADDDSIEFEQDGRGVEELVGRHARQRAAVDVAHIVHAGLQAGEIHPAQFLPNLRNGIEAEAAQFDLLAGGDIEDAVAGAARDLGDGAELVAGCEAVGHAHAHHELAGSGLAEKDADPLEQVFVGGREVLVARGDQRGQIVADAQRVPPLRRF